MNHINYINLWGRLRQEHELTNTPTCIYIMPFQLYIFASAKCFYWPAAAIALQTESYHLPASLQPYVI